MTRDDFLALCKRWDINVIENESDDELIIDITPFSIVGCLLNEHEYESLLLIMDSNGIFKIIEQEF